MRSLPHLLVLLLILGVVANIVVATMFALSFDPESLAGQPPGGYVAPQRGDARLWESRPDLSLTQDLVWVGALERPGLSVRLLNGTRGGAIIVQLSREGYQVPESDDLWDRMMCVRSGWPLAALHGMRLERQATRDRVMYGGPRSEGSRLEYDGAMPINRSGQLDWRFVPFRPAWAGLVVNSLAYSALLGVLVAPFWVWRIRRRRR